MSDRIPPHVLDDEDPLGPLYAAPTPAPRPETVPVAAVPPPPAITRARAGTRPGMVLPDVEDDPLGPTPTPTPRRISVAPADGSPVRQITSAPRHSTPSRPVPAVPPAPVAAAGVFDLDDFVNEDPFTQERNPSRRGVNAPDADNEMYIDHNAVQRKKRLLKIIGGTAVALAVALGTGIHYGLRLAGPTDPDARPAPTAPNTPVKSGSDRDVNCSFKIQPNYIEPNCPGVDLEPDGTEKVTMTAVKNVRGKLSGALEVYIDGKKYVCGFSDLPRPTRGVTGIPPQPLHCEK